MSNYLTQLSTKEQHRATWYQQHGTATNPSVVLEETRLEVESQIGEIRKKLEPLQKSVYPILIKKFERKATEAKAPGNTNEGHLWWVWAGKSLQLRADCLVKAAEAEGRGKEKLGKAYREAVGTYEAAADLLKRAAEAWDKRNMYGSHSWLWAGKSLQLRADCLVKAAEAEGRGKKELRKNYCEAAEVWQTASDLWKRSAEAHVAGKRNEGSSWTLLSQPQQFRAAYLVEAAEAEGRGKEELGKAYREAAAAYEAAADLSKRSAEAYAAGHKSEASSLSSAAHYLGGLFGSKAYCLVRAIELEEGGKKKFARGYREAAGAYEVAADLMKQSAKAMVEGRESDYDSLYKAGKANAEKADEIVNKVREW